MQTRLPGQNNATPCYAPAAMHMQCTADLLVDRERDEALVYREDDVRRVDAEGRRTYHVCAHARVLVCVWWWWWWWW